MKKISLLLILFTILLPFSLSAQLRLPPILGSHMVLQQNSEVKFWGWSYAQEKITISTDWDTVTYRTLGDQNADWEVKVKTPAAGGPYKITIKGYNTIVLEDVMVG